MGARQPRPRCCAVPTRRRFAGTVTGKCIQLTCWLRSTSDFPFLIHLLRCPSVIFARCLSSRFYCYFCLKVGYRMLLLILIIMNFLNYILDSMY